LITCNLTKLELALDQMRKSNPKIIPADAALLASALSLAGRQAIALYDGEQYRWPEDYERLTHALVGQLELVQEGIETTTPKRASKTAAEEEPVTVTVGLMPNYSAGERLLNDRDDLKAKLADILQEGVEFTYQSQDIGWQLALDRANWSTVSGHEISRRIKLKATFTEGAVGIEMGAGSAKKRGGKKAVEAEIKADEPVSEIVELDTEAVEEE
jgi:hypothetical protein